MYNVVELSNGVELACNGEFRGVFLRRPNGDWQQQTGTGQTPRFRSPEHFMRWVRSHWDCSPTYDGKPHAWRARRLPGGWR